jgi:hypothetical protein
LTGHPEVGVDRLHGAERDQRGLDREASQGGDQPAALGDGDEDVGLDLAVDWVVPAHEGLEADRRSGFGVDLGLVEHLQVGTVDDRV